MTDLIEATSGQCRTLADGTLRITVEVSPKDAPKAFHLFGIPGIPMALARLTQEAAIKSNQDKVIAEEKPKGGELAKLAGKFCGQQLFGDFLCEYFGYVSFTDNDRAEVIRTICVIESRAELDNNPEAAKIFHEQIRIPYMEWLEDNKC